MRNSNLSKVELAKRAAWEAKWGARGTSFKNGFIDSLVATLKISSFVLLCLLTLASILGTVVLTLIYPIVTLTWWGLALLPVGVIVISLMFQAISAVYRAYGWDF